MSDRIIDFNKVKNMAKDKDVDKFEDYIYSLYYKMIEGKINVTDFSKGIMDYMEKNNISQDKLVNIEKKFFERYGLDSSMLEEQFNMLGLNMGNQNINLNNLKKEMSFHDKYKDRINSKAMSEYFIKNDKNDCKILLEGENVFIISEKNIDLNDNELNEFLCSYKKVIEDKAIQIRLCENTKNYQY